MAKAYTATLFGFEATANGKKEAQREVYRKVSAALEGDYTPVIVEWRGLAALIWREPFGWQWRCITNGDGRVKSGPLYGIGSNKAERREIIREVEWQLAQAVWSVEDSDAMPEHLPAARAKEWAAWVDFQRRHKEATAAGLATEQAHAYACRAPGWEGLLPSPVVADEPKRIAQRKRR